MPTSGVAGAEGSGKDSKTNSGTMTNLTKGLFGK